MDYRINKRHAWPGLTVSGAYFFLAFVTCFSDNSWEEMELTDLTSVSCKLRYENKERLAKEKNKEIHLGGKSLPENSGS